jgi:hypothetical protein
MMSFSFVFIAPDINNNKKYEIFGKASHRTTHNIVKNIQGSRERPPLTIAHTSIPRPPHSGWEKRHNIHPTLRTRIPVYRRHGTQRLGRQIKARGVISRQPPPMRRSGRKRLAVNIIIVYRYCSRRRRRALTGMGIHSRREVIER